MNRQDIAKQVAENCGITKAQSDEAVNTVLDMVREAVTNESGIVLKGFGTFKAVDTKERMARNPKTGEPVHVPAGVKVKFKASKDFLVS